MRGVKRFFSVAHNNNVALLERAGVSPKNHQHRLLLIGRPRENPSAQQVIVVLFPNTKFILSPNSTAERLAVGQFLNGVQPGSDATISRHAIGVQVQADPSVAPAIELIIIKNRVQVPVNNSRLKLAAGVQEVVPSKFGLVRPLFVAVAQRGPKIRRDLSAPTV